MKFFGFSYLINILLPLIQLVKQNLGKISEITRPDLKILLCRSKTTVTDWLIPIP